MPTIREIELTLRSRAKELDRAIQILRAEQQGIEWAVAVVQGQTALQGDYLCDSIGKAIMKSKDFEKLTGLTWPGCKPAKEKGGSMDDMDVDGRKMAEKHPFQSPGTRPTPPDHTPETPISRSGPAPKSRRLKVPPQSL